MAGAGWIKALIVHLPSLSATEPQSFSYEVSHPPAHATSLDSSFVLPYASEFTCTSFRFA